MAEDPIKAVLHYAHALKAPRIRESAARLAEQARDGGWSHEEYLAAVLSREAGATKLKPKPVFHVASPQDELVKFAWQERMINWDLKLNGCGSFNKDAMGYTLYPSRSYLLLQ